MVMHLTAVISLTLTPRFAAIVKKKNRSDISVEVLCLQCYIDLDWILHWSGEPEYIAFRYYGIYLNISSHCNTGIRSLRMLDINRL